MIVHDELNTFDMIDYANLIDKIDDAKKDKIINLLIVFNCRNISTYKSIISKLIGIKNTYLPGIISLLINLNSTSDIETDSIQSFNTFFAF